MNKHKTIQERPPLETLACVNERCELYRQTGQHNLGVRKTYGQDGIRYLGCGCGGTEFSERKNTALWNTRVPEARMVSVVEHLGEGCSLKATARLAKVDVSVVRRLANRHQLVLLTDGDASYPALVPGDVRPSLPSGSAGRPGRFPHVRYRIPRTLAPVQIIKHREGSRVVSLDIRYAHGSRTLIHQMLYQLGYAQPNISAIERRNGTARCMSAHQVRRSLAFSRRPDTKIALGWWGMTVYNWCRPHCSPRHLLPEPLGKKVSAPDTCDGAGSYRLHWVYSRPAPHSCLLNRRSEIISPDYPAID